MIFRTGKGPQGAFPAALQKYTGPDLKNIGVILRVALCAGILYLGSLWQRPLFLAEFAGSGEAVEHIFAGSPLTPRSWIGFVPLKLLGFSPFAFRIVPALLTLIAAALILRAGGRSVFAGCGNASALIFLLTPAVFLAGTTALPAAVSGLLPVSAALGIFLFLAAPSRWEQFAGALVGTAALAGTVLTSGWVFLALLFVALLLFVLQPFSACREPGNVMRRTVCLLLPFALTLCLLPFGEPGVKFSCTASGLKLLGVTLLAGGFPWIVVFPFAVRDLAACFLARCEDDFFGFSLILSVLSLAAAVALPFESGAFLLFFAGTSGLTGAGLIAHYDERGYALLNRALYILAGIFLLAGILIAVWGALGAWTKALPQSLRLLRAKDAWALMAIVPAVTAVWCLTAARENRNRSLKFLSFCAGLAFCLFALHGLAPLAVVEREAPLAFVRQAVLTRAPRTAQLWSDPDMRAVLMIADRSGKVRLFSGPEAFLDLAVEVRKGEKACVVTADRRLADQLPFPKTTLRAGRFHAVFYNIDFPEMRMRKP